MQHIAKLAYANYMTGTQSAAFDSISSLIPVAVGSAVGALFAWSVTSPQTVDTETASNNTGILKLLDEHRFICADSTLYTTLQEPLILFYTTNAVATKAFLKHTDCLIQRFFDLRSGLKRPQEIPLVLKERRQASNRLHILVRDTRKKRPMAASEIQEEVEVIKKNRWLRPQ